jgi:SWI/SNF-related matrix-associated actin-dependent regulator of chromatin subfamily B member 1
MEAMRDLRVTYSRDDFEAWMKWMPFDKTSGQPLKHDELARVPEEDRSYGWVPRIKCNDCPGKQYTAAPNNAAENFEIHLRNRQHQQRVDNRLKGKAS